MTEVKKQEKQKARSKRFKRSARKAVDLATIEPVKMEALDLGATTPLLVTPAIKGVDLAEWAHLNRSNVNEKLSHYGAVLFRGFNTSDVAGFERAVNGLCPELFGDYGDLPKEQGAEKVYKSTPYPIDKSILFHNESSHMNRWPMRQFFGALAVADVGGHTPLADCRMVLRNLDAEVRDEIHRKGLLYTRNFHEGLDVSWQQFFGTEDRAEVEAICKSWGALFEWRDVDHLCISQKARGVSQHPYTGEAVFFGQIQLHHINYMDESERDSLLTLFEKPDLPRNVYFGDGTEISAQALSAIDQAYESARVSFPWQHGDLIMLDNMLIAHGRDPFEGERKIIVSMGEMVESENVPMLDGSHIFA